LQVDGGSGFAAEFEAACRQRGLYLFVLPPRSPRLNGAVERANRTHTEESYPSPLFAGNEKTQPRTPPLGKNTVRPHQAVPAAGFISTNWTSMDEYKDLPGTLNTW
jgi:putative transposase